MRDGEDLSTLRDQRPILSLQRTEIAWEFSQPGALYFVPEAAGCDPA